MKAHRLLLQYALILSAIFGSVVSYACTVASGVAHNGHIWNANNEDGPFGVSNFINVFPKQGDSKYGYYTLSYISPMFGQGGQIQGGMNEAGLTFDFATIDPVNVSSAEGKRAFAAGDDAILPHVLANMGSTEEVVAFFETYWFEDGFLGAQMHVADKSGTFATISPSGIQVTKPGQPLVTTNFDLGGKEQRTSCWRYPIAQSLLSENNASLATMMTLCKKTAQKTGGTMYSNIQNLTTGDIWFFSKHDPDTTVTINIRALLAKGQQSYVFSDLASVSAKEQSESWSEPAAVQLDQAVIDQYVGTYQNQFVGEVVVTAQPNGIHIAAHFAPSETLYAQSENSFFIPDTGLAIEFTIDEGKKTLHLYEHCDWSFSAWDESD